VRALPVRADIRGVGAARLGKKPSVQLCKVCPAAPRAVRRRRRATEAGTRACAVLQAMLQVLDEDKDGFVSLEEFKNFKAMPHGRNSAEH
jgi:hypothetical protein